LLAADFLAAGFLAVFFAAAFLAAGFFAAVFFPAVFFAVDFFAAVLAVLAPEDVLPVVALAIMVSPDDRLSSYRSRETLAKTQ
jgi:hypothetical protein